MPDSPQRHVQWDGSQQFPEGLSDSYSCVNQLHPAHVHTSARTRTGSDHTPHFQVSLTPISVQVHVLTSAGAPWGGTKTEPVDCCRSGDTRWGLRSMLQQKYSAVIHLSENTVKSLPHIPVKSIPQTPSTKHNPIQTDKIGLYTFK